jgi:hypothetical protein
MEISLDLGLSLASARLEPHGVVLPDGSRLTWSASRPSPGMKTGVIYSIRPLGFVFLVKSSYIPS